MKKGFTLVELLAVIVILAIVLAIAVPRISSLIESSRKKSLESDAKMLLNTVRIKLLENNDIDLSSINETTIRNYNVSSDNYDYLYIGKENNDLYIYLVGKNQMRGYKACGTFTDLIITTSNSNNDCSLTYLYTGSSQTFTANKTGKYLIELWGAQGTSFLNGIGGKGGYTRGEIVLDLGSTLYVYVGGISAFNSGSDTYPGGGATDIRLVSGVWNLFDSLKSRIMVAGGGGGAERIPGGFGGGLSGQSYTASTYGGGTNGAGGTQTSGGLAGSHPTYGLANPGTFGIGGSGLSTSSTPDNGPAGGGGYYGGGGTTYAGSAGGGSSFISGHTGCNAILESSTSTNIVHAGHPNHYSGYIFNNSVMIDGGTTIMNPYGGSEIGHAGTGFARITYLGNN